MLEQLTPAQQEKMSEVKDFWLDYIFSCKNNNINKEAAKIGIDWMYELAGQKKPVVIYVDSPLGCQYVVTYLKEFIKYLPKKNIDNIMDSVGASVGASVRDSVGASVWASVRDSVRDSVWDSKLGWQQFSYYGNIGDYGWISFYDFFTQIGIINNDKFNQFKNTILSGIYDMIQLNGFCIVSSLPNKIERDSIGRLHCSDKSAIKFNDGFELYFWHGVNVNPDWILTPDKITKSTIINEKNAEKRRCLMEILGESQYAELLDLNELSRENYNGRDVILFKTKEKDTLINDHIYFIKVECPSTGRYYYLCIPPNEAKDPISALSWTFGMNKEQYNLLIET